MKTCKKCGAEMRDEALFCTECGEKLESEEVVQEEVIQSEPKKDATLEKIKEIIKNKKMMAIVIGALVIAGVIIAFIVNAKNTIKVGDYCVVTYSGGDGFATANVKLDYESLETEICERKGVSLDGMSYWNIVDAVEDDNIEVSVTPNEELSNGDKIDIQVDVLNEKAVDGIKLAGGTVKHEVEGLVKYKEITDEELFKNMEIVYTNYSPFLRLDIENSSKDSFLSSVQYKLENNGEIANGDTIVIEAIWDNGVADDNQCIVVGTGKKEIKVEGQAEYLLNKEQVTEDLLTQIKQKLEEDYKASYPDKELIEIKDIFLVDATNGSFEVNHLYALMEVEPNKYGNDNWYYVTYYNFTIRDGNVDLGKGHSNSMFNFSNNSDDYDNKVEYAKAHYKACYSLMNE